MALLEQQYSLHVSKDTIFNPNEAELSGVYEKWGRLNVDAIRVRAIKPKDADEVYNDVQNEQDTTKSEEKEEAESKVNEDSVQDKQAQIRSKLLEKSDPTEIVIYFRRLTQERAIQYNFGINEVGREINEADIVMKILREQIVAIQGLKKEHWIYKMPSDFLISVAQYIRNLNSQFGGEKSLYLLDVEEIKKN